MFPFVKYILRTLPVYDSHTSVYHKWVTIGNVPIILTKLFQGSSREYTEEFTVIRAFKHHRAR